MSPGPLGFYKEFITFRDTSPLFDSVRGTGAVGFPLVQLEDGSHTRDIDGVLARLGIPERLGSNH